jgi:hypothetical protein
MDIRFGLPALTQAPYFALRPIGLALRAALCPLPEGEGSRRAFCVPSLKNLE